MKTPYFLLFALTALFACGNAPDNGSSTDDHQANIQKSSITKDVNAERFSGLLQEKPEAQLLDVRTPEEVADGVIPGAVNIDFYSDDFKDGLSVLEKAQPVMVYCASGGRSGKTMDLMHELGYEEIYNLEGGYRGWTAAGMPTAELKK